MIAARQWAGAIARASHAIGREVRVDLAAVFDRSGDLVLGRPGLWSPNRSCRLVRASDGWLAVNLPRADDRELVPAWFGRAISGDPWPAVDRLARTRDCATLLADARMLGLAVSVVGETRAAGTPVTTHRLGDGADRSGRPPRIVDLGSMWAAPLCGGLLAQAGAAVTRYHSVRRPDPSRVATPAFYARLNDSKAHVTLDFEHAEDRERLADAIADADLVVTSARPRAFDALGITPETIIARNPGLIWVAVTGHGWRGEGADRIAFGDDAAAAGGLVRRTNGGDPRFVGDALADPLTGLAAAAAALEALGGRGGVLLDAALSRVAAYAAAPSPAPL